ncbi:MAG TPA: hypothetical protein VJB05_02815 [archaeon]|nr:hypothetical protein [archaeon]
MLWGDNGDRVAEVFGYGHVDKKDWPSNPEIYNWVFRNGIHQPKKRQISCGDTLIVLGKEESVRRRTSSLGEYWNEFPVDRETRRLFIS